MKTFPIFQSVKGTIRNLKLGELPAFYIPGHAPQARMATSATTVQYPTVRDKVLMPPEISLMVMLPLDSTDADISQALLESESDFLSAVVETPADTYVSHRGGWDVAESNGKLVCCALVSCVTVPHHQQPESTT